MRVAVLCDVHGNLPAVNAVLAEIAGEDVDGIVIGGDVVTGPMPRETLERLTGVGVDIRFLRGNADREAVRAFDEHRLDPAQESDPVEQEAAFTAARLTSDQRDMLAALPTTITLQIDGLGRVMFCHGSPRSDLEIITTATTDQRLSDVLGGVEENTIVGGHTHRQTDRQVSGQRYINAGSVGRPYEGSAGAFWALLGPDVSLRRTEYDLRVAVPRLRKTGYPDIEGALRESLTEPIDPDGVASFFERLALSR